MLANTDTEHSRAEKTATVFSELGRRLSAASTPKQAATIILEAADILFGWDACTFDLCSQDQQTLSAVMYMDTISGFRRDISDECDRTLPTARLKQVLQNGPRLLLHDPAKGFLPDAAPFGDKSRPSAAAMYVPIHVEASVIGVLSIHSYEPQAYGEQDLSLLQALAAHCGGALERIRAEEDTHHLNAALRRHLEELETLLLERKRAEAALRERDERLRLALSASRMGAWTLEWGADGGMQVTLSPELEAILGLEPGEFEGTEAALFRLITPEQHQDARQAITQALAASQDSELELQLRNPRGRAVWLLARGRAYYDEAGKQARLAGVAIDITARTKAEEEVRLLNTNLERLVSERTAQLEATNKELEAFCYSVSHDLRAPLRSIRGFTEALLESYAARLDARGRDFLRRACDSSLHMDRLIEDLLKLSRVNRAELAVQLVDLSALAREIAEELRRSEPGRACEVRILPDLTAAGDGRLLRIVMENLLRNAWKFTARTPSPRIEFGRLPGRTPVFFVKDNGAGFDMANADKLFGVFQRLHSTTDFPGTGVGLATVRRVLNRHGGRIWAEAAENRGATFYFTLEPEKQEA